MLEWTAAQPLANAILHVRIVVPMGDYWRAGDGNLGNLVFLISGLDYCSKWQCLQNGPLLTYGCMLVRSAYISGTCLAWTWLSSYTSLFSTPCVGSYFGSLLKLVQVAHCHHLLSVRLKVGEYH